MCLYPRTSSDRRRSLSPDSMRPSCSLSDIMRGIMICHINRFRGHFVFKACFVLYLSACHTDIVYWNKITSSLIDRSTMCESVAAVPRSFRIQWSFCSSHFRQPSATTSELPQKSFEPIQVRRVDNIHYSYGDRIISSKNHSNCARLKMHHMNRYDNRWP